MGLKLYHVLHGHKSEGFTNLAQMRGSIPQFKVQQVQKSHTLDHLPTFTCHLTIAQLPPGSDGREASTRFTAEASTKKQAEQFAAERALDHIRSRGFLVPPFVSAVHLAGNQQQPPQSGHSNLGQLLPSLRRMPEVGAMADRFAQYLLSLCVPNQV